MVDIDTFLTILYVTVDDFDKTRLPPERRPGPPAALSRAEVLTLALMSQWQPFGSERAFYRYALRHWRGAFPTLPDRAQFNRLVRHHHRALIACLRYLVEVLHAQRCPFELLDATPAPTRDAKRRGLGWLPGLVDIGWSNRLGWYEGFHVLMAVNPVGVITGFGVGAASTKDQPLAETFLAARHPPHPALSSVGAPAADPYLTDTGFEGQAWQQHGREDYAAVVICAPKRNIVTLGLGPGGVGWRACARSSKRSMGACITPFASTASVRMSSMASRRAWPLKPLCTTSVSGSMSGSAARGSPLPISSPGSITRIHTKCLSLLNGSSARGNG